jgi:arylsulfatase A-like enzyme
MRPTIAPILLALAVCAGSACSSGGGEDRPNVVLVTMDTTRADYLSCYGYKADQPTSANLDRLAGEGTRFDLAMATAAVTPVSHASILTGRFNRDHGVRVIFAGSGFRLPEDVPTLATQYKAAGYKTIAVHSAFPVAPYFGFGRDFDVIESFDAEMDLGPAAPPDPKDTKEAVASKATWDQRNTRRSDSTMDIVLREVEAASEPFFLWIHLWDPHDQIHTPPERWLPKPEELYVMENGEFVLEANGKPKIKRPMTALYAAEIRYMDSQLGRLFAQLNQTGQWDNTITAVTSDHGQGLSDHGWAAHRILYQEQIRVPLIVRIPGVEQRKVVRDLVRTVDIAPTLLDFSGLDPLEEIGGRSLRPLIEGAADEPRITFAEQINGYDLNAHMVARRPKDDFTYCAMDVDWKLTWRPNHPADSELYHLAQDPKEANNLWAWDHEEAVRLKRELGGHAPWVIEPFPAAEGGADTDAIMQALSALGYTADEGGEVLGPVWEYVCPEHYDQRSATLTRCSKCKSPMILIAEGK